MDAILHGCIPVVVMDNVSEVFETVLDWKQFSIRIPEADVEKTPQILQSIGAPLLLQMQRALAKVWHRFAWVGSPFHRATMPALFEKNHEGNVHAPELPSGHHFRARLQFPVQEDAFATLMQWLHGRMEGGGPS